MKLSDIKTRAPKKFVKENIVGKTEKLKEELAELQAVLRAESKHAVLVVVQGMDAAGKDGTVKKVFSGMDPSGVTVFPFKAPTKPEYLRDFMWRVHQVTPPKGMIHIFNRSHYEDLIVPTVHRTFDRKLIGKRYDHINHFEEMLRDEGTLILKFYLHISKEEQARRFDDRVVDPKKRWKYNKNDFEEAKLWDRYMEVYERIIDRASIKWHVVPSDDKWYRNYVVAKRVVEEMKNLKMKYPPLED
jgi:PPK2 family polyphosphate:nucleotide phosphotransferase